MPGDRADTGLDNIIRLQARLGTRTGQLAPGGGIAFAVVALFVGVFAYLQDQRIAARPEAPVQATAAPPIILNLPPWPTPPAAAPAPAPPRLTPRRITPPGSTS